MSKNDYIYGIYGSDLEAVLVGKSITHIDECAQAITLNDGTVLELHDTADCCAYFNGHVKTIDLSENVITAVRVDGDEVPSEDSGKWTLTVLSMDKEICAVEIEGNASSGYYCHSIDLTIRAPK